MVAPDVRPKLWNRNFVLVFGSALLMFFSFYMLVPVLPFYVTGDLGASEAVAGVVLSLYTVAAVLVRPFSGYMVDKFARKPFYLLCYAIFAVVFAGYIIGGLLFVFVLLRVAHGMVFGTISVSASTLAIDVLPSERRAVGIGYFGMASNIAMATGPMTGLMIYEATYSFVLLFAIAFGVSAVGFWVAWCLRTPARPVSDAPVGVVSLDRFILVKGLSLSPVLLSIGVGYGIVMTYIGMYGTQQGYGQGTGLFFMIQAAGIIGARLLSAPTVNRGQIAKPAYVGLFLVVVGYALFALGHVEWLYYLCGLFLGLGYGFIIPSFQTMFVNLAPHSRRGTAMSTYLTSWDVGIGLGIAFGGWAIERIGFGWLFGLCGTIVVLGTLHFWRVGERYFDAHRLR